jgi:hypothetical protein
MHRIFNLGRLVETVVGVVTAVGVGGEPAQTLLNLGIRVMQVVGASRVDLQVREGRGQPVAVEVAVGLVVRMRLTSLAVLVRAMAAQVEMLHQQALLARRGLMQRDSYLPLVTMLLTGGVAVVVVVVVVVAAAAAAVPLIRVPVVDSYVLAAVVLETRVVVAAAVVAAAVVVAVVREGTEGAAPSGYSLSIMEVGDLWWIVALLQVVEGREVMGGRVEPVVAEPVVGVVVVPSRMAVGAGRVVRVRLEAPGGRVVAA